MGYTIFIIATMLVLPLSLSVIQTHKLIDIAILGKWFIFFGVGIRLLVAGLLQSVNPSITASILNVNESSYVLIRELGFANLIFGLLAIFSLFNNNLRLAATAGGFYMGLAGIYHIVRHHASTTLNETVALVSDLWILIIVTIYLIWALRN